MDAYKPKESDQSKFSTGIRDIDNNKDDGKFVELEQNPSDRRDPEESRHNEAGRPVFTQGDEEMDKIEKTVQNNGFATPPEVD